jgi:hypothetical protein
MQQELHKDRIGLLRGAFLRVEPLTPNQISLTAWREAVLGRVRLSKRNLRDYRLRRRTPMATETETLRGAAPGERSAGRTNPRSEYRYRDGRTRAGRSSGTSCAMVATSRASSNGAAWLGKP